MTSRVNTGEVLGLDGPAPSGPYGHARPSRPAAPRRLEDAGIFDFDRCLAAYDQGVDVSGAFDVSKFFAVTEAHYAAIPVPVVVVDYQPYHDVYDMAELVKQHGTLHISTLHGPAYWPPEVTTKTRAVHDWYAHIVPGNNFSWEGEINAYRASLPLYPEDLHWLVYSELILQAAQILTHHGVDQKIVYCRNGEPLRTYEAWRALNGQADDGGTRQQYGHYAREFLASAEVPFVVPQVIESQFQQ
jgi:hypothetical protein